MQTRSSDEKGVRPSVCQSNSLTWQNERKICPDLYTIYERSFRVVFWEEEWLVRATPSTWNFGSTGPRWSEIADFEPIFARSACDRYSVCGSCVRSKYSTRLSANSWSAVENCDIHSHAPKRFEIGCQLLLITNIKSHTGFWLVPTWMTLNDPERHNSTYFAFFFHRIR